MGKGIEIQQVQVGNNVEEAVDVELLKAQAQVYNHLFAYADTLALRSAIELRIADIIHSHGHPMTLSQIASKLEPSLSSSSGPPPDVDVSCLERVMRMLVRKRIFTLEPPNHDKYGLTTTSKLLMHDHEHSLAPIFLSSTSHVMVKPWFEIANSIKQCGGPNAFERAHGESIWELASKDHEFNDLFNGGMASATKPTLDAVVRGYKEGFSKLEEGTTLVDVGGGIGKLVAKIVEVYPHIKGINFDQPQVVTTAPQYPGVTHVAGDLFQQIPSADNIIIKSVLHDWTDEECLKILRNCQRAISHQKKGGKVIIVDVILHPNRDEMFDDAATSCDLLMMTCCAGGKERTEDEWRKLLKDAGFAHINIIPLQTLLSLHIIEAFLL